MRPGRAWLAVASLLLLAVLAAACQRGGSAGGDGAGDIVVTVRTPTAEPTPVRTPTPNPTPSPTATPLQVCSVNPDPAPPSLLQVQEPQPEEKVGVPFHLRGWGSSIGFENAGVAVAVVNAKQEVVQVLDVSPQLPARANRIPPRGLEITEYTRPFAADILLTDLAGPTPFCLWVYLETTEDGTPKSVVQVPVVVVP